MIGSIIRNNNVWYHRFSWSQSYQLIRNVRSAERIIAKRLIECYSEIKRNRSMIR